MPMHGYPFAEAEKSALGNNSQQNFRCILCRKTRYTLHVIQTLKPTRFIKMTSRMECYALNKQNLVSVKISKLMLTDTE